MNSDQQPFFYVDPPQQARGEGGLFFGLCFALIAAALAFLLFARQVDDFLQTGTWDQCRPILIAVGLCGALYLVGRVALGAFLLVRDRVSRRQG